MTHPGLLQHRTGPIVYWATTAVVVTECAVGGAMDLFRLAPFFPMLVELGYPAYLATVLGTAKIAAAVVIAAPGLRRSKEWAYAGVLINMVGAAASHAAVRHDVGAILVPLVLGAVAVVSWALRPPGRRLAT